MTSSASPDASRQAAAPTWRDRWIFVAILALTFVAYAPVYQAGFIWDDAAHVTHPALRSWRGLWLIWSDVTSTQQYYPLLNTTFWVAHRFWGDAPLGYHLLNLAVHAASACVLVVALRRLAVPAAGLAGLVFALHPVMVESVAWITELKNTQSTLFFLLAFWAYLRFDQERRAKLYAWATVFFVCALLSKTMTVTLPAAVLVALWWSRGRVARRDVVPLLPWFGLSIAMGLLTLAVETDVIGAKGEDFALTAVERCLLAGRIAWFYLAKLLWPANLIFIYPRWAVSAVDATAYLYPLGLLILIGMAFAFRHRSRGPLAALLLFLGLAVPVLGFFNVYGFIFSYVADHWTYLPAIPVIVLVSAALSLAVQRLSLGVASARYAAAALISLLGVLTFQQAATYRHVESFYRTIIAKNPRAFMPYNNLAVYLAQQGRTAEAIPLFERSIELKPEPHTHDSLGTALRAVGRHDEAFHHYQEAVRLRPDFAHARLNLANEFERRGRLRDAIIHYQEVVRLEPGRADVHNDLGNVLAAEGRVEEGLAHLRFALELEPRFTGAAINLGGLLVRIGRAAEAATVLEPFARASQPTPAVHSLLGVALAESGKIPAAIEQFEQVVRLEPRSIEAHENLARSLELAGRQMDARRHAEEAKRLRADTSR